MSEAKVRWGIKVTVDGKRVRTTREGIPFAEDSRRSALEEASVFPDGHEARLIKLTPKAKGWRPASEPPKGATEAERIRDVIVQIDVVRRPIILGWHGDKTSTGWQVVGHAGARVLRWRDIPKGWTK